MVNKVNKTWADHWLAYSYIPLLLLPLPLSLSPIHLALFLSMTYFLNRPCIYCSLLLLILFASSCHWSSRCFVDFSFRRPETNGLGALGWWVPRLYTVPADDSTGLMPQSTLGDLEFWQEVVNSTVAGVTSAVIKDVKDRIAGTNVSLPLQMNGNGLGLGWIRSLLGRSEWTLPCTQWKIAI